MAVCAIYTPMFLPESPKLFPQLPTTRCCTRRGIRIHDSENIHSVIARPRADSGLGQSHSIGGSFLNEEVTPQKIFSKENIYSDIGSEIDYQIVSPTDKGMLNP